MIRIKAGKRKAVASALTFCFFLQQSFCMQVLATSIGGVTGNNNIYNIEPTAINGDIGLRKYFDFELSQNDIANLIFYDSIQGKNVKTFLNLVDNKINIQGIVNTLDGNGRFTNGHAVFISPNGMVVGPTGVINTGSLSIYTPDKDSYDKYKGDVFVHNTQISKYEKVLGQGTASVDIQGKVLARDFVNANVADFNVANTGLVMAGVGNNRDVISTHNQANTLFNSLVNTDNLVSGNRFESDNGNIKILSYGSNGGTNIEGQMKNFGKGDTEITNYGAKGVTVSGSIINGNGQLNIDNTNKGVLVKSTGLLVDKNGTTNITNTGSDGIVFEYGAKSNNSTDETNITNSGANGIKVMGHIASNGINIDNSNSDVIIGYNLGENYLNSTDDVNIDVENGNVYNYGTKANLIKANGNLDIDVTNGAIGKEVGPCEGGVCTGINEDARDLKKSINTTIDGTIKAISTKGSNESLVNITSYDTDMNVDQIKADGRVILLADSQTKGSRAYDIVNRASNDSNPNVEGTGISMIASGSIGEDNKALTFRQNGVQTNFYGDDARYAHVMNPNNRLGQGVDILAINDVNVKGMDSANGNKLDTNVCAIISREGDVKAEFSGDTYIEETTAANNIDITTRGKNLYVNHLGEAPTTYKNNRNDYYGPGRNITPDKAKLTALDLGSYWSESEKPKYTHAADSTILVKNGRLRGKGEGRPAHEQDLYMVADNAYAGGYYFNMGKHRNPDGKTSVVEDSTTNPLSNPNGIAPSIRGKAVRPDDVTAIGKNPADRNYYYGGSEQGNDPGYDGVIDPSKKGTKDDDDNLVIPRKEPDPEIVVDTDNDTDTDIDTDIDTDLDTDIDNDTDIDTDTDTDNDIDIDSDIDTDTDTDIDKDDDIPEPEVPVDTDNDTDTDVDTDIDNDLDTDIDNDTDIDTDTDTDNDIDIDSDIDTDTDTDIDKDDDIPEPEPDPVDTDNDTDTDVDTDIDNDLDTDIDNDTDIDTDTDTDSDIDIDTDIDTDTDTDLDMDDDIPGKDPDPVDTDSDTDTDVDTDIDNDLDTDIDNDTDIDTDTDTDSDIDIDTDIDTDTDTDLDMDDDIPGKDPDPVDTDSDTDTDVDTDIDTDLDIDIDTDTDVDNDTDIDTDTDTDSDIDIDTDIDTDTDTDLDMDTDIPEPEVPVDTDNDTDTDIDTDIDTDLDIDIDTDTDVDNDTDIDTDTDTDSDIDIDTDIDTDSDIDLDMDTDIPEPNPEQTYREGDAYKQRVVENPLYGIDKRQYMRFNTVESSTPISIAEGSQIEGVLDISRGGMAISHHNGVKVGDIIPVRISYGNMDIDTSIKVLSATDRRAGTEFIDLDQATQNKILYMNMMLESQTAVRHTNSMI